MDLFALFGIIIVLFSGGVAVGMYLQRVTDLWWVKAKDDRLSFKENNLN